MSDKGLRLLLAINLTGACFLVAHMIFDAIHIFGTKTTITAIGAFVLAVFIFWKGLKINQ